MLLDSVLSLKLFEALVLPLPSTVSEIVSVNDKFLSIVHIEICRRASTALSKCENLTLISESDSDVTSEPAQSRRLQHFSCYWLMCHLDTTPLFSLPSTSCYLFLPNKKWHIIMPDFAVCLSTRLIKLQSWAPTVKYTETLPFLLLFFNMGFLRWGVMGTSLTIHAMLERSKCFPLFAMANLSARMTCAGLHKSSFNTSLWLFLLTFSAVYKTDYWTKELPLTLW